MLIPETITRRASEILQAKGLKPQLSEQAVAVVMAMCEMVNNNQLLVSKALIPAIRFPIIVAPLKAPARVCNDAGKGEVSRFDGFTGESRV